MIRFSLRLPDELHERLVARADADRRSVNNEILHLLEIALDQAPPTKGTVSSTA